MVCLLEMVCDYGGANVDRDTRAVFGLSRSISFVSLSFDLGLNLQ